MTVGDFIQTYGSILWWIIIGGIAGYVASLLLRTERQGCLVNVILGVAGAFVGGFVMNTLLPQGLIGIALCDTILHATIGSVIIILIFEVLLPGRQIGVRKDGGGSRRRRRKGGFNPFDFFNPD